MVSLSQKRCVSCGEWKDINDFKKDSYCKDGHRNKCKHCSYLISRSAAKTWVKNNPEKVKATARRYDVSHREINRARGLHNYYKDPEKKNEGNRAWRLNNPGKERERNKRWREANPEMVRQKTRNRRAMKKANGGHVSLAEWNALKEKYNFTCLRCGRREPEIKLTIDHVVSLRDGGKHAIKNIQPLCVSCNSSKGKRSIDYR